MILNFRYSQFKRVFDIFFSLIIFIFLLPIIILSCILLAINLRENPIFIQKRPGFREKVFFLLKLKTMKSINLNSNLIYDEDRITNFTNIIRRLRIDEFLQLLNVIKGDMSFVGPRPLLLEYLPLYNNEQKLRHSVLPGITGLAQINGSEMLEFEKRLDLDVKYVKSYSFLQDIKIILLTIIYVLKNFKNKTDYDSIPKM